MKSISFSLGIFRNNPTLNLWSELSSTFNERSLETALYGISISRASALIEYDGFLSFERVDPAKLVSYQV